MKLVLNDQSRESKIYVFLLRLVFAIHDFRLLTFHSTSSALRTRTCPGLNAYASEYLDQ